MTPAEQLNPVYWTPERVARVRRASPRTFRMHVKNEYGGASTVFDFDAVEAVFRAHQTRIRSAGRPFGVIDASSGKKDAWSFAVGQWVLPVPSEASYLREPDPGLPEGILVVDDHGRPIVRPDDRDAKPFLYFPIIDAFEGEFWDQISAEELVARVAVTFHDAGVRHVHADQREAYTLASLFAQHRLLLHEYPYTPSSKPEAVARVRRWLATGVLVVMPHERLRQEFHSFVEKPTPGGGFTFGARGSGHDDYVSLLLTAALADIAGELRDSPIAAARGGAARVPHEALG